MLRFLQLLAHFETLLLTVSGELQKSIVRVTSDELERAKFHPKFGGRFATALSFIVDAFLKRGNAFKSQVRQSHVIELLHLLQERDIFVNAHTSSLFYRIATRSTASLPREAEFLDAIAGVVSEENLAGARRLLADGIERQDPAVANFFYITLHHASAPKSASAAGPALVPVAYEDARARVTALLKRRFPTKAHKWLDALGTCVCRLKTRAGVSELTLSLRQQLLIGVLAKGQAPLGEIVTASKLPQETVEAMLRTLTGCRLAVAAGAAFGVNPAFCEKKITIADNWDARPAKVKNMSQARLTTAQACIIKIMKGTRQMSKQQLIERVLAETSQLFPMSINDLRQCVQLAIAERYIEEVDGVYLRYIE
jgi:hypothetical protein